jgi:hypothetical protein
MRIFGPRSAALCKIDSADAALSSLLLPSSKPKPHEADPHDFKIPKTRAVIFHKLGSHRRRESEADFVRNRTICVPFNRV